LRRLFLPKKECLEYFEGMNYIETMQILFVDFLDICLSKIVMLIITQCFVFGIFMIYIRAMMIYRDWRKQLNNYEDIKSETVTKLLRFYVIMAIISFKLIILVPQQIFLKKKYDFAFYLKFNQCFYDNFLIILEFYFINVSNIYDQNITYMFLLVFHFGLELIVYLMDLFYHRKSIDDIENIEKIE
jgi:hypothetical protein